jgi:hypothetical protein
MAYGKGISVNINKCSAHSLVLVFVHYSYNHSYCLLVTAYMFPCFVLVFVLPLCSSLLYSLWAVQ